MIWFRVFAFSLLSTSSFHPALLAFAQEPDQSKNIRTITLTASEKQPGFTLRISAKGRTGLVEVRNHAGVVVETLGCSLLRDAASPSKPEMKAVAEEFVTSFAAEDLDFDGHIDLKGPWEFGAKWARYCVWFYDPESQTFSGAYRKRPLAEQMELLYNLEADPQHHRIIAHSIGPVEPMWDEYRIQDLNHDRPYWPRLIPVKSCLIQNNLAGKIPVVVVTRYEGRLSTVTRRKLQPESLSNPSADHMPISNRKGTDASFCAQF